MDGIETQKNSRKARDSLHVALGVSGVRLKAAPASMSRSGLLGWICCTVNQLRLDGLTLRRTADGRLALSFPAHRDGAGRQHFYVRPVDDHARRAIEQEVFQALGIEEGAWR